MIALYQTPEIGSDLIELRAEGIKETIEEKWWLSKLKHQSQVSSLLSYDPAACSANFVLCSNFGWLYQFGWCYMQGT